MADSVRLGSEVGIHAAIDKVDLAGVVSYADGVVHADVQRGLRSSPTPAASPLVQGAGRLTEADGRPAVTVGGETYAAPHLVLATGSYPRSLPGSTRRREDPPQSARTSTRPTAGIGDRARRPGAIRVEFASIWRSFGVDVTIVEALPRLVSGEDPSISTALERAFGRRKIKVLTGSELTACETQELGVRVEVANGQVLEAELMLVAVGRGPYSADLGYQEAGIELEDGFVRVNERLETSVPGVFALGDLVRGLQLAHRGFAQGIFVAEEIAHRVGSRDRAPQLFPTSRSAGHLLWPGNRIRGTH